MEIQDFIYIILKLYLIVRGKNDAEIDLKFLRRKLSHRKIHTFKFPNL